jgi:hypothetical protein
MLGVYLSSTCIKRSARNSNFMVIADVKRKAKPMPPRLIRGSGQQYHELGRPQHRSQVPIWKPRTRNIERQTRAYEKNQKVQLFRSFHFFWLLLLRCASILACLSLLLSLS